MSLFSSFGVTFPSNQIIEYIYKTMLDAHLAKDFPEDIQHTSEKLVQGLLKLYDQIKEKLPRTPVKFHYIFNLRDLSRVTEGLF